MSDPVNMAAQYLTLAELHIARAEETMLPQVRERLLTSAEKFAAMAGEYARFAGNGAINRIDYIY